MKKNSLTIILIIIIILLTGYIIFDKFVNKTVIHNNFEDEKITFIESINLDYVNIYLSNDGLAYIVPLNNEDIDNLDVGRNLKERLHTLYERAFYYDVYINNNKLKGYRVKLDKDITKLRKIVIDDITYIVFIKENNTIGLFNYDDYYNLLKTNVIDNFGRYKNIKDIINNKVIYLDGSKEDFKVEK